MTSPPPPYQTPPPWQPGPTGYYPPPVPPRSNRRLYLIFTAAAVALVGIALGTMAALGVFSTKTFTMHGSIAITDSGTTIAEITMVGDNCQGTGPYSDLTPGTAVIVQDPAGKVVATGQLEPGSDTAGVCTEPFTVPSVPDGLSSYSVTISHRGTQVFQPAQAHSGVALTIGNN